MIDLAGGPYGHNLETILQTAVDENIKAIVKLTDQHCDAIRQASAYYMAKVFEYPAPGEVLLCYPNMPPIDVLFDAASVLVASLEQPCLKTKQQKVTP